MGTVALSKEWQSELERAAASSFVLLPIELQARGYDYNYVAKSYLEFLKGENSRQDKLTIARKFSKFISNVNRNRVKSELGPDFFEAFEYYMNNFDDLMAKPDRIGLETLELIQDGLDRTKFVEDVISFDEIKLRATRIAKMEKKSEILDAEWKEFEIEYKELNP